MIVKTGEADRFVARPPGDLVAALFYGPDAGLVHERADKLARSVVEDLSDPFRVADFAEVVLVADNARLFDEVAAISMIGGRRLVRVRGAGNALAGLFEDFLDDHAGDALVVVEAGDLAKGAGLRKIFEEAKKAAAIACYPDNAMALENVVRDALKAEGIGIEPDALADAVSRLGSDRGVTRREIEKLVLYAQGQKKVTLEDVRAVMGDEAEARSEEVSDAAGSGDFARLDLALERLWVADASPVQVVRQALSHFQRLLLVKSEAERGASLDDAMRKLRPPLHFSRTTSFRNQAQRWSPDKLSDALELLFEAETLCKTTGVPPQAALGRALLGVAAMAKNSKGGSQTWR
jgi:DNA polymerase-3 subunit delta